MAPESIRAAVSAALLEERARCLDSEDDRQAVARTVTQRVLEMLGEEPDGPCTVCGRSGICGATILDHVTPTGEHPHPLRTWVVEECDCGARRLAEHEHTEESQDEVCVIAATPWRAR